MQGKHGSVGAALPAANRKAAGDRNHSELRNCAVNRKSDNFSGLMPQPALFG